LIDEYKIPLNAKGKSGQSQILSACLGHTLTKAYNIS